MMRGGAVWDRGISTKGPIAQLAWKIYCICIRYVGIYPTIFLYAMHLTLVLDDFEVKKILK